MAAVYEVTPRQLFVRQLGLRAYLEVAEDMRRFTNNRTEGTLDEMWVVQHYPVFTQGQAGKPEHLLAPTTIPVIQTERGGQITYHGPGQLVIYPLLDIRRLSLTVRDLVSSLELTVVDLLKYYGIDAAPHPGAPGVYVGEFNNDNSQVEGRRKIASLGLRIRRGYSFHGVAINVDMDLEPFKLINPCGYQGLQMTQMVDEVTPGKGTFNNFNTENGNNVQFDIEQMGNQFAEYFANRLQLPLTDSTEDQ